MMSVSWTSKALSDVSRLHEFLAVVNAAAAAKTVQALVHAPTRLQQQPRLGERVDEFDGREVRRLLIGHYEMRYEIQGQSIYILRIWHTRERR